MSGTRTVEAADVGLVVAVKRLSAAKTRLAPVFSAADPGKRGAGHARSTPSPPRRRSPRCTRSPSSPPMRSPPTPPGSWRAGADRPDPGGSPQPAEQRASPPPRPRCVQDTPNIVALQGDLPALQPQELAEAITAARALPAQLRRRPARHRNVGAVRVRRRARPAFRTRFRTAASAFGGHRADRRLAGAAVRHRHPRRSIGGSAPRRRALRRRRPSVGPGEQRTTG